MSLGASAITKPLDAFVKETGQSFRQYETGVTNAAAVVVVSDWTLDYPRPVPPKVHVGLPALTARATPVLSLLTKPWS